MSRKSKAKRGNKTQNWLKQMSQQQATVDEFDEIIKYLPENLEEIAATDGVIKRRRCFKNAQQLLRAIWLWIMPTISLRLCASMLGALKIRLTESALRNRFQNMAGFLGALIAQMFQSQATALQATESPFTLRLLDSSCLQRQGKTQTDWRLHATYDPVCGCSCSLELTDAHGAEFAERSVANQQDVLVGDCNYGTARNFEYCIEHKLFALFRAHLQRIRLLDILTGQRIDPNAVLDQAQAQGSHRIVVQVPHEKNRNQAQLVILPIPEDKAAAARNRLNKAAKKKARRSIRSRSD